MAITKTVIQNSPTRTTIKLSATAGADTSTIYLKKTITLASPGDLTFVAGSDGKGTITRSTGSWVTDFTSKSTASVAFVTIAGSASNNKTFSVKSWTAATIVVQETVIAETYNTASTPASYESDVGFAGQSITTPQVNISKLRYSLGGSATVVRNTVNVATLYGNWMGSNDGLGLAEQNTQDLVCTFVTSGGTLILELVKVGGVNTEDQARDEVRA